MRVAVLLCVALGGCFDDPPGLYIVARDSSGRAASAELIIGADACNSCGRITPANSPPDAVTMLPQAFAGTTLFLDGSSDAPTARTIHDFDGGEVSFHIVPADGADAIDPVAIAIVAHENSDAMGAVVGVTTFSPDALKAGDTAIYDFHLAAAETVAAPSNDHTSPDDTRVLQWSSTTTTDADSPCTMIEDVSADAVARTWFVPPNDHDCDGIPDGVDACKDTWDADSQLPAQAESAEVATCVSPSHMGTECRLGVAAQATCGGVPSTSCSEWGNPRYCVPSYFCSQACTEPLACIDPIVGGPSYQMTPSLGVPLQFGIDGGACPSNPHTTIFLGPLLASMTTQDLSTPYPCATVMIWDVLHHPTVAPASIKVDLTETEAQVNAPITLHADVTNHDLCTVEFYSSTPIQEQYAPDTRSLTWAVAIDITLLNGRHIVLPAYFKNKPCGEMRPATPGISEPGLSACAND